VSLIEIFPVLATYVSSQHRVFHPLVNAHAGRTSKNSEILQNLRVLLLNLRALCVFVGFKSDDLGFHSFEL